MADLDTYDADQRTYEGTHGVTSRYGEDSATSHTTRL